MDYFLLLAQQAAQQAQDGGNPILMGALRGAIFGGILGGLIGAAIWGIKKLSGGKPKT
jgi:hypothetical protein